MKKTARTLKELPPFTLKRSQRARHIRINITPAKGVELVVPRRASEHDALAFLHDKREWVEKQLRATQLELQRTKLPDNFFPSELTLPSIDKHYRIIYQHDLFKETVRLYEMDEFLVFNGAIESLENCMPHFKRWLKGVARKYLTPLMQRLSEETGLTFNHLSFRFQKTLWGSCAANQNISLNCKLLFLPPEVVRYVLIHELCHTIHFNHSKRFWGLVKRFEPNYKALERELRTADKHYIPAFYNKRQHIDNESIY